MQRTVRQGFDRPLWGPAVRVNLEGWSALFHLDRGYDGRRLIAGRAREMSSVNRRKRIVDNSNPAPDTMLSSSFYTPVATVAGAAGRARCSYLSRLDLILV